MNKLFLLRIYLDQLIGTILTKFNTLSAVGLIATALSIMAYFGADDQFKIDIYLWVFLLILGLTLYITGVLLSTSWEMCKKIIHGFALLPDIASSNKPSEHFPESEAILILPYQEYLSVGDAISIYFGDKTEELIGIGFVEKKRDDGTFEIVVASTKKDNDKFQKVWQKILEGNSDTLKKIRPKVTIPSYLVRDDYLQRENISIAGIKNKSQDVSDDGSGVSI
jgi:hypothetical protein